MHLPKGKQASVSDGVPLPRRYAAIAAMSFGSALVIIDGGVANVALPTIARDLRVDQSSAVSVVTIYQVMLVMLMLPLAGLGERIGIKRIYQGGQALFTVATLLCFFAKSLPFLLLVRAVQAVGAAGVLSVASALIRQIYPAKQLGRGLGINSVVVTSSAAAAPTIGGLILSVAPWPWGLRQRCALCGAQPGVRTRHSRPPAIRKDVRHGRRGHVRGDVRADNRRFADARDRRPVPWFPPRSSYRASRSAIISCGASKARRHRSCPSTCWRGRCWRFPQSAGSPPSRRR